MKTIPILLAVAISTFGCTQIEEKTYDRKPGCSNKDVISAGLYSSAPSGTLSLVSLEIEDNCMAIAFSSVGCSGETWETLLIDSEAILDSSPPQRNLRLSLMNEEPCKALIYNTISFDISNLQVNGNRVQLNITNTNDAILYEYP